MQTFISITAVSAMSIMLAITNPPPDSIELTGTVRDLRGIVYTEAVGFCRGARTDGKLENNMFSRQCPYVMGT